MISLYAVLNRAAKQKEGSERLRAIGHDRDARRIERHAITAALQMLREVMASRGYLHIGGGGSFYDTGLGMFPGHPDPASDIEICAQLSIPVLDTRTVPSHNLAALARLPMVATQHRPVTTRSRPGAAADIVEVFADAASLGAVAWLPVSR